MLKALYTRIQKMLEKYKNTNQYMSELDRYISSKHPQSPAEIEHWVKQFDLQQQKGWLA